VKISARGGVGRVYLEGSTPRTRHQPVRTTPFKRKKKPTVGSGKVKSKKALKNSLGLMLAEKEKARKWEGKKKLISLHGQGVGLQNAAVRTKPSSIRQVGGEKGKRQLSRGEKATSIVQNGRQEKMSKGKEEKSTVARR